MGPMPHLIIPFSWNPPTHLKHHFSPFGFGRSGGKIHSFTLRANRLRMWVRYKNLWSRLIDLRNVGGLREGGK